MVEPFGKNHVNIQTSLIKLFFLGDYVDHYPQEGDLDDLQALKDVIEFVKDKDNVF